MASRCRKFQPNVFNKLKCQHCFGQKDHHSAEALENFKVSSGIVAASFEAGQFWLVMGSLFAHVTENE